MCNVFTDLAEGTQTDFLGWFLDQFWEFRHECPTFRALVPFANTIALATATELAIQKAFIDHVWTVLLIEVIKRLDNARLGDPADSM